ncbi:hypothetical protein Lal_00016912 [Lupinus albus]|nr:hypothetical protein Lal_00016912 [Lupinus albus]
MSTITNDSILFGGKIVVFGGDFRPILQVVPGGCRLDIVHAAINASYLWNQCTVLTLTKNMRLQNHDNAIDIRQFSEWILKMGDEKLSEFNDSCVEVNIAKEIPILDYDNPIDVIVSNTYPNLQDHYKDEQFLQCRVILASTIEIVDQINDYVLSKISGNENGYLSSHLVDMSNVNESEAFNILIPEFLNSLATS